MQLNNMRELKDDYLKSTRFRVIPSPSFVFDRNHRYESKKSQSNRAHGNIIGASELTLPQIT